MFLAAGLLIVLILFLFAYRWYHRNFNYWTHFKTIPSVPGRLLSGNLLDCLTFKTNFSNNLQQIYEDPKFKNEAVVGVYTFEPALLVRDPELIKSILIRDFDNFHSRVMQSSGQSDTIGARIMIFSEYSFVKGARSKLSHIFSGATLKQIYPLIQQVGEHLENFVRNNGDSVVYDLKDLMGRFATETFTTTVFGINSNALENPSEAVHVQAKELTNYNWRRGLDYLAITYAPKLRRIFKPKILFKETEVFFKSTARFIVQDRESSGQKRNDMIDIFVKLKEEAKASGQNMDVFMDSIAGHMAMFMGGGHETSMLTISNTLFELAKHPEIQERLRHEIVDAFVQGNGGITYESFNSLEYLNMVVAETLRMYPVLPVIERKFHKLSNLDGGYSLKPPYDFDIPDGMGVYISALGLHHDPQYWIDPVKFDPERFAPHNKNCINPMAYLPFGHGPRNCIGGRLGQMQVKTAIAYILKNHSVNVCAQTNLKPKLNGKSSFLLQTVGETNVEIVKDDLYNSTKTID